MSYVPLDYWEERGKRFDRSHRRLPDHKRRKREFANLIAWIEEIQPANILEIGAGWGAVYQALGAAGLADDFTMCDFTDSMREGCEKRTGILPDAWDGKTLLYPDDSFDLILTFHVLLHVLPADIEHFFSEEVRVARNWLFIASLNRQGRQKHDGHCFIHDYQALANQHSLIPLKEHKFGTISHWLFQKG